MTEHTVAPQAAVVQAPPGSFEARAGGATSGTSMAAGAAFLDRLLRLGSADARTLLGQLAALPDDQFRATVAGMTAEQTRAFLAGLSWLDEATHRALLERFKSERVVGAAAASVGKLDWVGPSGPLSMLSERVADWRDEDSGEMPNVRTNHFMAWLLGGPEPDPDTGAMNCWEVFLFLAYRAGVVSKEGLLARFYSGDREGLHRALGFGNAIKMDAAHEPERGDLVFFSKGGDNRHTMLSLGTKDGAGNHEVLSLWNKPAKGNKSSALQRTTIEELARANSFYPMTEVTFTKGPW
jgi:hypothetical protein